MNLRTIQLIMLAAVIGIAAGVGAHTFVYADEGASYLTNDPAACADCHIMGGHYSGWLKSGRRSVAPSWPRTRRASTPRRRPCEY